MTIFTLFLNFLRQFLNVSQTKIVNKVEKFSSHDKFREIA